MIVINLLIIAKTMNVVVAIIASIFLVANEFESLNLECELN